MDSRIPQDSRRCLEGAIRLLGGAPLAEEMILWAYTLGKFDGRLAQLDIDEAMLRERTA